MAIDKRDECGCYRECMTYEHECSQKCIWPSCLTEEEALKLADEIYEDSFD